jgi:hypothetical protein
LWNVICFHKEQVNQLVLGINFIVLLHSDHRRGVKLQALSYGGELITMELMVQLLTLHPCSFCKPSAFAKKTVAREKEYFLELRGLQRAWVGLRCGLMRSHL